MRASKETLLRLPPSTYGNKLLSSVTSSLALATSLLRYDDEHPHDLLLPSHFDPPFSNDHDDKDGRKEHGKEKDQVKTPESLRRNGILSKPEMNAGGTDQRYLVRVHIRI